MMSLKVGFTGTQKGMTYDQKNNFLVTIRDLNNEHHVEEFHHGDCVGADASAHEIAKELEIDIYVYPPINNRKRAFCTGSFKIHPPKDYIERNHDIVDNCDILIACPKSNIEELRSGTWATVRYARKIKRPVIILKP